MKGESWEIKVAKEEGNLKVCWSLVFCLQEYFRYWLTLDVRKTCLNIYVNNVKVTKKGGNNIFVK